MQALVMCLSDPSSDPRPNRIIRLLSDNDFKVDILSHPFKGELPIRKHYSFPKPSQQRFQWFKRGVISVLGSIVARFVSDQSKIVEYLNDQRYKLLMHENAILLEKYDIIVVEDLQLLPLAIRVRIRAKVLFDAREFYTRQYEESLRFRWFEYPSRNYLCRYYLSQCDQCITVSQGLADGYYEDFGVHMELIRSTPNFINMPVQVTDENNIRIVHHGVANKNRGIENMIDIVISLDERFTFDLYLVGSNVYINELKQRGENCDRIRFCKPVAFEQIIPMLNNYDIGFFYLEPVGFNVTHMLPNKFFEFIQARLAIAIGPSKAMAPLVHEYQCGFIAPEFTLESMTQKLQSLTLEDIDKAKRNSDRAAHELCFEVEGRRLLSLVENLIN